MSNHNFTTELAAWDQLLAGFKANQEDLPHLELYLTQLAGGVAALRAIQSTRTDLAEESRRGTLTFYSGRAQVRDLAARLRDSVLGHYGHRSAKLTEFGIKPAGARRNPTAP
jgi:hypothetical protein